MNKVEITVDVNTGKISKNETPFSASEIAHFEQIALQAETEKAQTLAVKQSALAKLLALGLTEEEALALGVK